MSSSTVEKLSVSIPGDVMMWVREEAQRSGASVSAVLAALARARRDESMQRAERARAVYAYLDELAEALGVAKLTAGDLAEADAELRELGLL